MDVFGERGIILPAVGVWVWGIGEQGMWRVGV